jgi:hypothetical protein
MNEHKANREYKSSMFVNLFGEQKPLIEIFNAFHGTNLPLDTPIKIATLDDTFFKDKINDLAFVVEDKLVILIEHQSTINSNMPLRFLIYVGRVYEKIVSGDLLYKTGLVQIPTPEFIVLYNGVEPMTQGRMTLKLSDAFKEAPELARRAPIELEVSVYNVNEGKNRDLVRRSETLKGYVTFIAKAREFQSEGLDLGDALTRAIQWCIDADVLADYMKEHGSEVWNMLMQEWKLDKALDVR